MMTVVVFQKKAASLVVYGKSAAPGDAKPRNIEAIYVSGDSV